MTDLRMVLTQEGADHPQREHLRRQLFIQTQFVAVRDGLAHQLAGCGRRIFDFHHHSGTVMQKNASGNYGTMQGFRHANRGDVADGGAGYGRRVGFYKISYMKTSTVISHYFLIQ